jgi:hypothetical protein
MNNQECCNHNCNQGRDCPLRKKELTDEEIEELARKHLIVLTGRYGEDSEIDGEVNFARAILRKAQEK